MASGDVNVQSAVHSLDQGRAALLIKLGMAVALVIALSLLYLFVQFRGFSNPSAMDQAQIARNLANGQGYTTQFIRPVAFKIIQEGQATSEPVNLERFPDFYQSPLNPFVNSLALQFVKNNMQMSPTDLVSPGERAITIASVIMFLISVGVWFLVVSRLFDSKLAFFTIVAVLVTDLLWQYSLSGLPQMLLLLLFSVASLFMVFAMEAAAKESLPQTLLWVAAASVVLGLMTLAHGLAVWLFLGWLLFAVIYFRPRALTGLAAAACFLIVVSPWLVRNYQVCGNPFGLAVYDAFFEATPEQYQRAMEVNPRDAGISLPGKIRANLMRQLEGIFGLIGLNLAAGAFFVALFHPFRNRKTAMFKWAILAMWVFAVLGMSLYRGGQHMSENQIHVLFIPLFAAFGLAFILVLWGRLEIGGGIYRTIFITVILFACAIPMLATLFAGQKTRIQWPPYVPPFISILGDWFDKKEVVASDMPWAVAWYADRISFLMPETMKEFNRLHDYVETKQPIVGLYLTPLSGNQRLFADIYKGEYRDWAPLILRPPKVEGFPLPAYTALPIEGECIIFADRDRWSKPRQTAP